MRRAAIAGRQFWVAPEQCSLGSRPNAENDVVRTRLLEQIAIAVAKKASSTGADLEEAFLCWFNWRHLKLTNRGLLIREAKMLGPILGRERNGHLCRESDVD